MRKGASQSGSFVITLLLASSLLLLPAAIPAQSGKGKPGGGNAQKTTFSGRATVVNAQLVGLPAIILSDTGALDSTGGEKEASLLEHETPGLLKASVLHATTVGNGNKSRSEASVVDLDLTVGGNTIAADFLMARAEATCAAGENATGGSEIARLVINGQEVAVTGEPNQTINLPAGGTIIINEQTSPRRGDITVNALHVVIPGVADVTIASAHADITCGKASCPGKDFVTGGGWIVAPSGDRGTFGVAGGIKGKDLWGHLTYIDHGTRMKVKAHAPTGYTADGNSRTIVWAGNCEVDGRPGQTCQVTVTDNGEPGRDDLFSITVDGYTAGGPLAGGNIQLHKPCK